MEIVHHGWVKSDFDFCWHLKWTSAKWLMRSPTNIKKLSNFISYLTLDISPVSFYLSSTKLHKHGDYGFLKRDFPCWDAGFECARFTGPGFILKTLMLYSSSILKGILENTDKDRIKRLIRLKPPTEFSWRNAACHLTCADDSKLDAIKANELCYLVIWTVGVLIFSLRHFLFLYFGSVIDISKTN